MTSEYRVGRLARGISGGCSHDGIYRLEERVEEGNEPDYLEVHRTPVWIVRKEAEDPTNQCGRSARIGVIRYLCEGELELMEDWKPGDKARLKDGRVGTLQNPRGCFCGPKGEECWDIAFDDEEGGIQAHGALFRRIDKKRTGIQ